MERGGTDGAGRNGRQGLAWRAGCGLGGRSGAGGVRSGRGRWTGAG